MINKLYVHNVVYVVENEKYTYEETISVPFETLLQQNLITF